jgi:hypothetical protein
MASPQKNKGSGFEREVAKFLSTLYSASFNRAPGSGAFVGGVNVSRKNTLSSNQAKSFKGDIVPPDDWHHYNCEAKFYADFPFHLLLSGKCSQLDKWIAQMMEVADEGDLNLLFMKFNRKGRYVAVSNTIEWKGKNFCCYSSEKFGDWRIFEFEQFFADNKALVESSAKGL